MEYAENGEMTISIMTDSKDVNGTSTKSRRIQATDILSETGRRTDSERQVMAISPVSCAVARVSPRSVSRIYSGGMREQGSDVTGTWGGLLTNFLWRLRFLYSSCG